MMAEDPDTMRAENPKAEAFSSIINVGPLGIPLPTESTLKVFANNFS